MENVTIKNLVKKAILCYDEDDVIEAWNMYCRAHNKEDYHVYSILEFGDVCGDMSPLEIASAAKSYKFTPDQDKYFSYDEIGRLTSFNDIEDETCSVIDMNSLSDWFIENKGTIDGCGIIVDIKDIIDIFTQEYLSEIYEGGYRLTMAYMEDFCKLKGIDFENIDIFNFDFNGMMMYYAEMLG